ncbi:MAG: LacI family DNA-binding transcriptional regulator [Fimbriimonadaceae bacterium]|nr:LacI family DNA-binding transcriptional regulator [Fimbriimonadaceae bacterium]QYK55578.1 MAG: LacI family DNA-binding transcriptional regulator [Fimbriimonadaceae bacterium]
MRVTQQHIAKYAQVSQATVSRVLAGDDRVETEIRDKVMAAIEQHNYRPDVRARSLRTRCTHLIGLAIQRPEGGLSGDPFYTSLISELLDGLSHTDYHLCLDTVPVDGGQWQVYDELLRTRRVDGLVLVESEANDERLARLQKDKFPFVLIGNPMDARVWSVDNDNVYAGQIATEHLFTSGYRRVGFIAGPEGITVSEDRIEGYRRIVQQQEAPVMIWHADFGQDSARETALAVLQGADAPDALVVLDDFMAMGVVDAARRVGKKMPQDLGIVSFNDSPVCRMLEGGLSSVSLDIHRLVSTALEMLFTALSGEFAEEPRRTIVPSRLMVRGSSVRTGGLL